MTQAKTPWRFSTGERGRNRVRAFAHPKTGTLFLELWQEGRRKRIALGHRDAERAKAKAEEVAAALRREVQPSAPELTLETLFDNYEREVTPRKSTSSQQHDRRVMALLRELWGAGRRVSTLSRRDWDAFIHWRMSGSDRRAGKVRGKPVRARVVTQNLKTLRAMLNWATMAGDGDAGYLLERDPLKGLPFPKEQSVQRPILTDGQYHAMLKAGRRISPLLELALVLAHETGHRIGSIRLLRWSDIDLAKEVVRWRGENDKIGYEHVTPLTPNASQALSRTQQERPMIGDTWVLPSPSDSERPVSRHLMRDWWQRCELMAHVPHARGLGWHSLRRQFATEMKEMPLKDLCHLGGWKEPQTILKCYQRADERTMREALARRKPLKEARVGRNRARIDTPNHTRPDINVRARDNATGLS